jgi:GDP-4-dehydro-6-deoxy-D-mannose reductase
LADFFADIVRTRQDMAPVLVTGAAGFAGSHLVDLLAQSHDVLGWRRPGSSLPKSNPDIEWQLVDLLDRTAVGGAIAESRPSVVYHCAGAAHVGQSWTDTRETLATNVLGTHHLLDALRVAGITARVLIPGSSYVYRQSDHALSEDDAIGPASPYGLSKLAQEMLGRRALTEDDQQVYLTRSFNHIGPRQDPTYAAPGFARQIALIEAGRMAPTIEVGNLDAGRDLTDVRDTVRAYRDILEKGRPGVTYNVCSGRATKIRDVLDLLVAMSRVPLHVRVDPNRLRRSDTPLLLGNPTRLENETGWTPAIPLAQTLSELLDYWRKEIE